MPDGPGQNLRRSLRSGTKIGPGEGGPSLPVDFEDVTVRSLSQLLDKALVILTLAWFFRSGEENNGSTSCWQFPPGALNCMEVSLNVLPAKRDNTSSPFQRLSFPKLDHISRAVIKCCVDIHIFTFILSGC